MSVQVASCTLQELLNTNQQAIPNTGIAGQLTIPEYQRPYVWREKQINRLLNDLIEYQAIKEDNKPMYYLGSIILHQDGDSLKIIDGQQRLTTALLLHKIAHPHKQSGISYSSEKSIRNIQHNLSYLKSIQNKDVFDFRDISVFEDIDFDTINITLIVTDTEDLAYTFFETQNTGGVRLDGSDILKAHHLRAIFDRKNINYQARRWESIASSNVEYVVQLLTKMRFWDNRNWKRFPFYRDSTGIKNAIIDEYTLKTTNNDDVSYYYSAVKNESGRLLQMHESAYKQLKQPLANGNNTLDYINDYISLQNLLFGNVNDHRIDDRFYDFRDKVLHGENGTLFLKELFEMGMIAYVSRFGFYQMFEASLWLYRMIYSIRVSMGRNVREDSIFKFVYDHQFIDNILEVYTTAELFNYLKRFSYTLSTDYLETNSVKSKHIETLQTYFKKIGNIEEYKIHPKLFDKHLMDAINDKIKPNAE